MRQIEKKLKQQINEEKEMIGSPDLSVDQFALAGAEMSALNRGRQRKEDTKRKRLLSVFLSMGRGQIENLEKIDFRS